MKASNITWMESRGVYISSAIIYMSMTDRLPPDKGHNSRKRHHRATGGEGPRKRKGLRSLSMLYDQVRQTTLVSSMGIFALNLLFGVEGSEVCPSKGGADITGL